MLENHCRWSVPDPVLNARYSHVTALFVLWPSRHAQPRAKILERQPPTDLHSVRNPSTNRQGVTDVSSGSEQNGYVIIHVQGREQLHGWWHGAAAACEGI